MEKHLRRAIQEGRLRALRTTERDQGIACNGNPILIELFTDSQSFLKLLRNRNKSAGRQPSPPPACSADQKLHIQFQKEILIGQVLDLAIGASEALQSIGDVFEVRLQLRWIPGHLKGDAIVKLHETADLLAAEARQRCTNIHEVGGRGVAIEPSILERLITPLLHRPPFHALASPALNQPRGFGGEVAVLKSEIATRVAREKRLEEQLNSESQLSLEFEEELSFEKRMREKLEKKEQDIATREGFVTAKDRYVREREQRAQEAEQRFQRDVAKSQEETRKRHETFHSERDDVVLRLREDIEPLRNRALTLVNQDVEEEMLLPNQGFEELGRGQARLAIEMKRLEHDQVKKGNEVLEEKKAFEEAKEAFERQKQAFDREKRAFDKQKTAFDVEKQEYGETEDALLAREQLISDEEKFLFEGRVAILAREQALSAKEKDTKSSWWPNLSTLG